MSPTEEIEALKARVAGLGLEATASASNLKAAHQEHEAEKERMREGFTRFAINLIGHPERRYPSGERMEELCRALNEHDAEIRAKATQEAADVVSGYCGCDPDDPHACANCCIAAEVRSLGFPLPTPDPCSHGISSSSECSQCEAAKREVHSADPMVRP